MKCEITLIGNAGFRIETPDSVVLIDAFYRPIPTVASRPAFGPDAIRRADFILVTHDHGDHFEPRATASVAQRTAAVVIGPPGVIGPLVSRVPRERLVTMDPPLGRGEARSVSVSFPAATTVTGFRTSHGDHHVSYLVETAGFRLFHDGDNEDTRLLDAGRIGVLDALLIAPWFGSGWVELIERLGPRCTLLMHLSEEELAAHTAGAFLPDLTDHVPEGVLVLEPGQNHVLGRTGTGTGAPEAGGENVT